MELTPHQLDELLASWALDALDADEMDLVTAAIANDPAVERRAATLRRAVAALAPPINDVPRPTQRLDDLMQHVSARPRDRGAVARPETVYADQVTAMKQLLDTLDERAWDRPALPYDWTVHGLVAHLLVIECYTSARFGMGGDVPDGSETHLGAGAELIAASLGRSPTATARSWHDTASGIIDGLAAGHGPAGDDVIDFHGWPFTADQLLVVRGFELWTHADDIRRAVGRPLETPGEPVLRTMSRLSVSSLPLVMPLVAPERATVDARVVLTGDGGGTFDLGDAGERTALVVADVVDYCRLAARRIEPDRLECVFEGDTDLGRDLLRAAQVFAV